MREASRELAESNDGHRDIDLLLIIFLLIVLVIAALIDVGARKIPNLLNYQAMAIALSYHCLWDGVNGLIFSWGSGLRNRILYPYLTSWEEWKQETLELMGEEKQLNPKSNG